MDPSSRGNSQHFPFNQELTILSETNYQQSQILQLFPNQQLPPAQTHQLILNPFQFPVHLSSKIDEEDDDQSLKTSKSIVIDDDMSDGEYRQEDPTNNQKMQMTSILGGRDRETGKITESSKEEDEEIISQRYVVTHQKNASN